MTLTELYRKISRKAKTKPDKIDIIDTQEVMQNYFDLLLSMSEKERANITRIGLSAARKRKKRRIEQ